MGQCNHLSLMFCQCDEPLYTNRLSDEETATMPVLTMTVEAAGSGRDTDGWEHDAWSVTLTYGDQSADFPYRTGTGLRKAGAPVAPTLASVMESLVLDYEAATSCTDVADYAENYGFTYEGPASLRRLLATWQALGEHRDAMNRLFGSDVDEVLREEWSELSDSSDGISLVAWEYDAETRDDQ